MRHLACLALVPALFLAGCPSGGGTFIPKKDGGTDAAIEHPDGGPGPDGGGCGMVNAACNNGDKPCCQGLSCVNGSCFKPNTCKNQGEGCLQTDVCCNGLLCNSFDSICEACGMSETRCTKTADCCNGFTCNLMTNFCQGMQVCSQNGAACMLDADCCSGICNNFTAKCANCGSAVNAPCANDTDCCGGQGWTCNLQTNLCWQGPMCKQNGQACNADGDCCGKLCNSFSLTCAACGANVNTNCGRDADCCTGQGWTCNMQTFKCWQGAMCGKQGVACAHTLECCQGFYCENAKCTNAPMCKPLGGSCPPNDPMKPYDPQGYLVCCDSDSMECISSKCCIDKMYQVITEVKCHVNSDCCPMQTCNVQTGMCQ